MDLDCLLFYSWQSDSDQESNRYLLRNAIKAALGQSAQQASIQEAIRLDQDTQGVAGTPEIAGTIFGKLDRCHLLIADVTLVAETPLTMARRTKKTPNPNVLLKTGYAAAVIGWNRIILVMNEFYGSAEDQIFDLRHRRFPIRYQLEPGDLASKKPVLKGLGEEIGFALRAALAAEHDAVDRAISTLDGFCLKLMAKHPAEPFKIIPVHNMGDTLTYIPLEAAINRMMDQNLLRADLDPDSGTFWYLWTYLGRLVIQKLQLSKQIPER